MGKKGYLITLTMLITLMKLMMLITLMKLIVLITLIILMMLILIGDERARDARMITVTYVGNALNRNAKTSKHHELRGCG